MVKGKPLWQVLYQSCSILKKEIIIKIRRENDQAPVSDIKHQKEEKGQT